MKARVRLLGAICLACVFGCSSTNGADKTKEIPTGAVILRGAGATFPSVLYKHWFSVYQSQHPKTIVSYDAVGSGEGVERFIGRDVKEDKLVDFGASDAAMTDEQISQVNDGVVMLPATAGILVLVYNVPDFAGDLKLSREAYAGIFLGDIKNWNDRRITETNPGVKLPNLTIAPVVRQDGSGTTYAFSNHLDAISAVWHGRHGVSTLIDWPGNAMRAADNEGVAGRVANSSGAIGYVGYEFARKVGLKMAILENRQGRFVSPNPANGIAALSGVELPENLRVFVPDPSGSDAYPIVTFSWILLRKHYDDQKGRAIRDLFQWSLTDGQTYANELGYIQFAPNVIAKSLVALRGINSSK